MFFTLLIWCTATVIYFSGRSSKVNWWCAAGFLVSSLGTLKEFAMDSVVPLLKEAFPQIPLDYYRMANSWMTAVLYLGVPFCFITLAMCFCELDEKRPVLFRSVQVMTVGFCAVLLLFFPPWRFKTYQETSLPFWYCMSTLNLGYALAGSVMIVRSIKKEIQETERRRRKLLTEILLPPYYWWLVTIFVIHTFRMYTYMKVWKANLYLSLVLFLYYLYIVLRDGMMGFRLSIALEPWNSDIQAVDKSTHYINHMIKHQTVKIDWCVDNLRESLPDGQTERELDIIARSSRQLREFSEQTAKFLSTRVHHSESVRMSLLVEEVVEDCRVLWEQIAFEMEYKPDIILSCDVINMKEVLLNILENAKDAMEAKGTIQIKGFFMGFQGIYCLMISDTGAGMSERTKREVFAPYFTTKRKGIHYGLGLAFCRSILLAHGGKIKISSKEGDGTQIRLFFPRGRVKKYLNDQSKGE